MAHQIGLIGVGYIGRGIATCFLARDVPIKVFDTNLTDAAALDIESFLRDLVEHDCADRGVLDRWRSNYRPVKSLDEFADCDFVIESVAENIDVKTKVFDQLEQIIRPDVPLTTNTSAIPISLMQKTCKHPERFAGMHWAPPAHVSRFIEVIRGEQTSDGTIETIMKLARDLGKDPALLNRDIEGFIVNRLCYAVYREALSLLDKGIADADTIDRCWSNCVGNWAPVAGPLRWMDLTGVSLYAAGMRRIFPTLANDTEVPMIMKQFEAKGIMGISNGEGFYSYTPERTEKWRELLQQETWRVRAIQEKNADLLNRDSE
jgi:3-hydroxybutyryl-CoA dehydrogenase